MNTDLLGILFHSWAGLGVRVGSLNQSLNISLAGGPATLDPSPPFSTRTVATIWGFATGANTVNHAWGSPFSVSAVPVLQATLTPLLFSSKSKKVKPVPPDAHAPIIPFLTKFRLSLLISMSSH